LEADCPVDLYLMVGVGAANAGELVVGGRGIAFVCLEHFTGKANPHTSGLGLAPHLLPLWIAHEVAHAVRYTSPTSRAALRRFVAEVGGYYDYWDTGSRASLRELLVNEGGAVAAARAVAPGFEPWEYCGYRRRRCGPRAPSSSRRTIARWGSRRREPEAQKRCRGATPQPAAARGARRVPRARARVDPSLPRHDAGGARLRPAASRVARGRSLAAGHGPGAPAMSGAFKITVTKEDLVFAAAHFITLPGHRCETLHGHNYRVGAVVEGGLEPETWFVVDFIALKRLLKELTEELDHRVLLPAHNPK